MKNEKYWLGVLDDMRNFRWGMMSFTEFKEKYPSFCVWEIRKGIRITIPEDCPLNFAADIILQNPREEWRQDPKDTYVIEISGIKIPFQPEWKSLPQIGLLRKACNEESSIEFSCYLRNNGLIEMMRCIERGDNGDSDGYGMEPDTWLKSWLKPNGEWNEPFYIVK